VDVLGQRLSLSCKRRVIILSYLVGMNDQSQAARALRHTIRATRRETEDARGLAPHVVEGLISAGLCRLAIPASLGGCEAEPPATLEILEELAWADASVAWIVWINQFVGLASRYSSDAVRTEVFKEARFFAASTRPSGRAVAVKDGFRISGRWALVSGCELADWIAVMCVVLRGTEPRMLNEREPETRMAYLPKGTYRMYEAAGTSALYVDCPIERGHRDIHAVMQHIAFGPFWLAAGRVRLGLSAQNPIF